MCECEYCSLSEKAKLALEKICDEKIRNEIEALFEKLFFEWDNSATDLDILKAKIDGSWPNQNGKYFTRIKDKLYEINSKQVE